MNLNFQTEPNTLRIVLSGDYLLSRDDGADAEISEYIARSGLKHILIEADRLEKWDSTLVAFLYGVIRQAESRKLKVNYSALPDNLQRLLHLALAVEPKPAETVQPQAAWLDSVGNFGLSLWSAVQKGTSFVHQSLLSLKRFIYGQAVMRRVDLLFALENCSYKAIGIVSLVSFMVGLILAFVGAVQLKTFGAQIYVASLVAIGMTRIMGAIMIGIIMAGRTGASFAATIGSMQVNEEIDALRTMGISVTDFLVLPRIIALTVAMPFLTLWADMLGILGGAAVGVLMLDINPAEYWKYTSDALNMTNFWVGIFHGFIFGIIIALCGCYYGINSGRNADSVGKATTSAVVSAIVWMIVATGIITWIFEALGI